MAVENIKEIARESCRTIGLAVPIIVGQVGQHVLHLIDTIMIGQVGRVPLAASAFAGGLIAVLMMAAIGFLSSISVLVARARGAEHDETGSEILRHGSFVALGFGMFMAALSTVGVFALRYFGQPPEVELESRTYFVILGWSMVPGLVFIALKQFCEGRSQPAAPMVIMLVAVVLNVFLNWVLIFGNLGSPALGLAGAGWATLISRATGMAILVWYVVSSSRLVGNVRPKWFASLDRKMFAEIFRIGFPIALQLFFEAGVFTAGAVLMGWLGTVQLAAHQIAISCIALIFMAPLGMSVAVGVRIGTAVGECDSRRVRVIGHGAMGSTLLFMCLSAAFLATAGEWVATMFVDDVVVEAPVIALAGKLLSVAALFQLADGLQVVSIGALRGLLDVKVPTAITFVAYWVVALPLAYVFGFSLGFDAPGLWSGLAAGLMVSALLLAIRFELLSRRLNLAGVD